MMLVYSILILLGITSTVSATGSCFQFTWDLDVKPDTVNCSDLQQKSKEPRPCILPIVFTEDFSAPDTRAIWNDRNRTIFSCPLVYGFTCIKYSYTYNNAVEHISYMCGKMTQNNETPITDGCYTSQVKGYTIEACACLTRGDNSTFPCNSTSRPHTSTYLLIILASISMIGDYRFFRRGLFFYVQ